VSRNAFDWDKATMAIRNFSRGVAASPAGDDNFAGVGLLSLHAQAKYSVPEEPKMPSFSI
jgi:hypothetical protein